MDKKQLKELLESLSVQLRTDIKAAQTELANAKSVANDITNLFERSSELVTHFEDPETGFSAILTAATLDTAKLTDAANTADDKLASIRDALNTVQQNILAMQTAYAEFEAVKAKIDDPSVGLNVVLQKSADTLAQITANSNEVTTHAETVRTSLITLQQNITTMQATYATFESTKSKIDDPTSGLNAVYDDSIKAKAEIDAIQTESETVYAAISRFKDTAAQNSANIETFKEDSETALKKILTNKDKSESLKEQMSNILSLASQKGHANYFDGRSKRLEKVSWMWLGGSILAIVAAVVLALLYIAPLTKADPHGAVRLLSTTTVQELIVRSTIITPLLLLGLFGANNYVKERRLAEHYAFRAVTALSIEGSILLLSRALENLTSDTKSSKIIEFAITTMSVLYAEPQDQVRRTHFNLRGRNKLVEIGTELNRSVGEMNQNLSELIAKDSSKTN